MKNKLFTGLNALLLLTVISFTSCKKGENDPFLSFKSRTARLKGDWTLGLKNATISNATNDGTTLTTVTVNGNYNGTEENVVTVSDSTVTSVFRYTFNINFDENGSYSYTLNLFRPTGDPGAPYNNSIYTVSGAWAWLDQGADKLGLSLSNDFNPAIPDSLNPNTLFPYNLSGSYYVDKLASDELVLKRDGQYTNSIDGIINTLSFTGTFTFKR
jgi:hypothetical protein